MGRKKKEPEKDHGSDIHDSLPGLAPNTHKEPEPENLDKGHGHHGGWHDGPLPPDTWGWGGVTKVDQKGSGFYFADFHGDHVKIVDGKSSTLRPEEVGSYNNCLDLPPICHDDGVRLAD
jgi:hypothetical protein